MASVSQLLTRKLWLKVNEAKSAVARPEERKFLGFRLGFLLPTRCAPAVRFGRRCRQGAASSGCARVGRGLWSVGGRQTRVDNSAVAP